jgi:hypothetical protein
MTEIILALVILALIVGHLFYVVAMNKQVLELNKLIKSKDTIEFASAKNIELNKPMAQQVEEFSNVDSLSDEQFMQKIKESING